MNETIIHFFLKSFLSLAVMTAFTVLWARNPVYSLIGLVLTFLFSGMFLIVLSQDFLGITLIIVYVGAITVLFLFVIMTLNIRRYESYTPLKNDPIRLIAVIAFVGFTYYGITAIRAGMNSPVMLSHLYNAFYTPNMEFKDSLYYLCTESIATVGNYFYTEFSVLFILAGFILLVTMIGAVIIAQDDKTNFKKQVSSEQIARNPRKSLILYKNKK